MPFKVFIKSYSGRFHEPKKEMMTKHAQTPIKLWITQHDYQSTMYAYFIGLKYKKKTKCVSEQCTVSNPLETEDLKLVVGSIAIIQTHEHECQCLSYSQGSVRWTPCGQWAPTQLTVTHKQSLLALPTATPKYDVSRLCQLHMKWL